MEKKEKYFLICTITIVAAIFLIFVLGSQIIFTEVASNLNDNEEVSNLKLKTSDVDLDDNSTWGYDEWRQYLINKAFNVTETELDPSILNNETTRHNLHVSTIGYWGYYNGSFNENDMAAITDKLIQNSVSVTITGIPVHNDEKLTVNFQIKINSGPFTDYYVWIYAVGLRSQDSSGNWYTEYPDYVEEHVWAVSPYPVGWYGLSDPWWNHPQSTIYSRSVDIATHSIESGLSVMVEVGGYINSPIRPLIVLDVEQVDLVDDDIIAPIVNILEPSDYPETQPIIDDSEDYFSIKLRTLDQSNIARIIAVIAVDGVNRIYTVQGTEFTGFQWQPIFWQFSYDYTINIPNPLIPGNYTVIIMVFDEDKDREADYTYYIGGNVDQMITAFAINFTVIDDDDTGPELLPPSLPVIGEPYLDNDLIKLPIAFEAYDESGVPFLIVNIYDAQTGELSYNYAEWYFEPNQYITHEKNITVVPGIYHIIISIRDGDSDRIGDAKWAQYIFYSVIVDVYAPETDIIVGTPSHIDGIITYVNSATEFSLLAGDDVSGVAFTTYFIDGELFLYTGTFNLQGYSDGIHIIAFYSIDNVGNIESIKTKVVVLDSTEPVTQLIMSDYYIDEIGTTYITASTEFTLSAIDTGSGVAYTKYSIDDSLPFLYDGQFNLLGYSEGAHTIAFYSVDKVGNIESINTKIVVLDSTNPVTQLIMSDYYIDEIGTTYIAASTEFALSATDTGSGVAYSIYFIDGQQFLYTGTFNLLGYSEGAHTIAFYSVDNVGNIENINAKIIVLDSTNPVTQLCMSDYYIDEIGTTYITASTDFTLSAIDTGSGVAYTKYSIDDSLPFLYDGQFNLLGYSEGAHTIKYYGVDNLGNGEYEKSITVNIVSLNIDSYLYKDEFEIISNFDIIFTKYKDEGYKLVATNPGQIFYAVEITNDWPIPIESLSVYLNFDTDFIMKGTNPIHIYLDNVDITELCIVEGNGIVIPTFPSLSQIKIIVHLDYDLKGGIYPNLEDFEMECYLFEATINVNSNTLMGTYQESASLFSNQKKTTAIAGFILDSSGNPIAGLIVELYDSQNNLIDTAITDENGFFYFINIDAGEYHVKVQYNSETHTQIVIAVNKELTVVNFNL